MDRIDHGSQSVGIISGGLAHLSPELEDQPPPVQHQLGRGGGPAQHGVAELALGALLLSLTLILEIIVAVTDEVFPQNLPVPDLQLGLDIVREVAELLAQRLVDIEPLCPG